MEINSMQLSIIVFVVHFTGFWFGYWFRGYQERKYRHERLPFEEWGD